MPLLLYCFVKGEIEGLNDIKGIDNLLVQSVEINGINALYSKVKDTTILNDLHGSSYEKNPAVIFQTLIQWLHTSHSVIPIRLPTFVPNEQTLKSVVSHHAPDIFKVLNGPANNIEHSFRIKAPDLSIGNSGIDWPEAESPGINYLKNKYLKSKVLRMDEGMIDAVKKAFTSCFMSSMLDMSVQKKDDCVRVHLLSHRDWRPTEQNLVTLERMLNTEVQWLGEFPPFHFINLSLAIPKP